MSFNKEYFVQKITQFIDFMTVFNTSSKFPAIIPARGGSKRIPRKNVRDLCGKPLLRYAVDSAIEAEIFDQVIVSSDDLEVEELVSKWDRVTFHRRSPNLSDDYSRVPQVIHSLLSEIEVNQRPKDFCVLLPPCPFRTSTHIKEAYKKFVTFNREVFLVSVTKYDFPPQFALRWPNPATSSLEIVNPEIYMQSTRSQSVEPLWHPNGAIYMCNTEAFLNAASFFAPPLIGYEMSPQDSLDLDWPYQFTMAESLLNYHN